jgi:hypothetical protein
MMMPAAVPIGGIDNAFTPPRRSAPDGCFPRYRGVSHG